ncbi:MAG: thioredoxin family protein [Phycisphaerales bacterium JB039]
MPPAQSTLVPLGSVAPDFDLPDYSGNGRIGRQVAIGDFAESPLLLAMFICNHCPFVLHVLPELARLGRDLAGKGFAIVAINPNDVERYPDDRPEKMTELAREHGLVFPYLFDRTQAVAMAYRAACTPDFFLYDAGRRLVYRGQLDDARPRSDEPVTGADLRRAIDLTLAGEPVPEPHRPSIGCSIKWKPGAEPDYARPTA